MENEKISKVCQLSRGSYFYLLIFIFFASSEVLLKALKKAPTKYQAETFPLRLSIPEHPMQWKAECATSTAICLSIL